MQMTGIWQIKANPTDLPNGASIASYLVDAAGALLTSTSIGGKQRLDVNNPSEFVDGTAYTAASDYLEAIAAVDSSGNYKPLNLNSLGELKVAATVNFTAEHNEDDPFADGDSGIATLLVRQDTLATSTSADADYGSFKSNALGELYVHDTSVLAQLVTANSTLTNIKSDTASIVTNTGTTATNTGTTATNTGTIASTLTALSKAEDAVASSGDMGIQSLLVRQDTLASSTSTDGDYGSFKSNAKGELYVKDSDTLAELVLIKSDTASIASSATAINGKINDYSTTGSIAVADVANIAILQQQVSVTSTAAQVPAANLANRRSIMLQNTSSAKMYIGSATVTTSGATTGIELPANSFLELECGPTVNVFAVKSGAGSLTLNVLEVS